MAINKIIVNKNTIVDLTQQTATKENVLEGTVFFGKDGVRTVGEAISYEDDISTVIERSGGNIIRVPEGVEVIGYSAFDSIYDLEEIYLPSTLSYTNDYSFNNLYNLRKVHVPNITNYFNIYFSSYYGNPFEASSSAALYVGEDEVTDIEVPDGIYELKSYMFGSGNVANITLPESVSYINYNAFNWSLQKITFASTNQIYSMSYSSCEATPYFANGSVQVYTNDSGTPVEFPLDELHIPDGMTDINQYCFAGANINKIYLPSSLTYIGYDAFASCYNISECHVNSIDTWLNIYFSSDSSNPLWNGGKLFINGQDASTITDLVLPEGTTAIKSLAGFEGIKSLHIPSTVTSITSGVFDKCKDLETITIAEGNKSYKIIDGIIYNYALTSVIFVPSKVTSCTLPDTVTNIGTSFKNKTSLKELHLTASITSISSGALYGCSSLEELTIPFVGGSKKTATQTYQYPFGYIFGTTSYSGSIATTQLYVNSNTSSASSSTYYIPISLKKVTVLDGYMLRGAFYGCNLLEEIDCSALTSCTSINDYFAYQCYNLKTIKLPDTISEIKTYSFASCGQLSDINIPTSLTTIGTYAFRACLGLRTLDLKNSMCKTISDHAFFECNPSEIYLPSTLTSIGNYAFCYSTLYKSTNLKIIYIPASVITIGNSAIGGNSVAICTPLLSTPSGWSSTLCFCETKYPPTYLYGTTEIIDDSSGFSYFKDANNLVRLIDFDRTKTEADLSTLSIIETVSSINVMKNCFIKNKIIEKVKLTRKVTKISDAAFYKCSSLEELVLPFTGSVEKAYTTNHSSSSSYNEVCLAYLFYVSEKNTDPIRKPIENGYFCIQNYGGWSGDFGTYSTAYIPKTLRKVTILGGAFNQQCLGDLPSLEEIVIGAECGTISPTAFRGTFASITVDSANSNYKSNNGSLYNKAGTICLKWNSREYKVFDPLTTVTTIEEDCCYDSSIYKAYIPSKVTSIKGYAFGNCNCLMELYNYSSLNISVGETTNGYAGYYVDVIHKNASDASVLVTRGDYIYSLEGSTPRMIAYLGTATDLVLPESYDGGRYIVPSRLFYNNIKITSLTIPDVVTSTVCVKNCLNLERLTMSKNSSSISDYGLYNTISLETAVFPTAYSVGREVFRVCGLKDFDLSGMTSYSYLSYLFDGCSNIKKLDLSNTIFSSIGYYMFFGCERLYEIKLPIKLTSISTKAFAYCRKLLDLRVPPLVSSISSDIFTGIPQKVNLKMEIGKCPAHITINVSNSNTTYGNGNLSYGNLRYVVYNNEAYVTNFSNANATTISIPSTLGGCPVVGIAPFLSKNTYLKTLELPSSLKIISDYSFNENSALTTVNFSNLSSLENIGERAFYKCTSLSCPVDLSSSKITTIKSNSFAYTKITSLKTPSTLKIINHAAFIECYNIASIELAEGIETIKNQSFQVYTSKGTSPLTRLELPESLTTIEDSAFSGHTNVTYLKFSKSMISIGGSAFAYFSVPSLTIPADLEYSAAKPDAFSYWQAITSFVYPSHWSKVKSLITGAPLVSSVTIPEGYTHVNSYAIDTLPSLTSITFPSTITTCSYYIITNCANLTEVHFKSTTPPTLDSNTFKNATAVTRIYVPAGCGDAYKAASIWSNYADKIVEETV